MAPLRSGLRVFLATGSGRAGSLLFLILASISAYVLLTYPLDFGLKSWSNPAVWADNPKAAPPGWLSLLSPNDYPPHRVFEYRKPTHTRTVETGGVIHTYLAEFHHTSDRFPTLLTITLQDLAYHDGPPRIFISLTRPDGHRLVLAALVPPGPLPGEEPPIHRYVETPMRLRVGGEDVAALLSSFFAREYGVSIPPKEILSRGVEEALFGQPAGPQGPLFRSLRGAYSVRVEMLAPDPRDRLASVKVVVGGSSYGSLGTDSLGRDIGVGLLFGFPVALFLGLVTSTLATAIGSTLGMIGGLLGGRVDSAIQRASDIAANVPLLPLLIYLTFALQPLLPRLWTVVLILVAFGWPGLAITVRSMLLQIRSGQLIEAAVALGASKRRIMVKHVFPQIAPFILGQMIFFAPSAILAEAGLSFLGLGDPSIPTWGQILESGFRSGAVYLGFWWWVLPPGLLIILTAMAFVLVALGLEPVINPRLRRIS
jgi:peptide/nickel transport system permease protein